MMETLAARLRERTTRRAEQRRAQIAEQYEEVLPGDVTIAREGDDIMIAAPRIRLRWLRDPAFAVLRAGPGALL